MTAKTRQSEVIETDYVEESMVADDAGKLTDTTALNNLVVIPALTYDAVIWDNKKLPLDTAASRAYMALKVGGIFIVEKCQELEDLLPVLLSMFDMKETKKGLFQAEDGTKKDVVVFVKEK